MPLSVTVNLSTRISEASDGEFLSIRVHVDGQDGQLVTPWYYGFERDLVVPLESPSGGYKMSAKEVKSRSARQERKRIEAVGGRRHSGSGSKSGYKSDGSLDNRWRMENKFTTTRSYRVTRRDLLKLRSECLNGQEPVFNIDFQDKHTGATEESWVIVPSKAWERLVRGTSDDSGPSATI